MKIKENLKKIVAAGTAFAMGVLLCAPGLTAFAAGSNTITVAGAQANETYSIYKMLDLEVNEGKTAYSYTVNTEWADFFAADGAAYVDINGTYVTWKSGKDTAADMEAFAKAAAKYAAEHSPAPNKAAADITPDADSDITFSALEDGYYLVTSTNGTLAMALTTPADPNATINEKNTDPNLAKNVKEDSAGTYGAANDAQIGDTVDFQLTVTLEKGAKNYVIHDDMGAGLKFNADSVSIDGLAEGTDYTVKTADLGDDCEFEIAFTKAYLDSLDAQTTLTVAYTAEVTSAINLETGALNNAKLTWGSNSSSALSTTTTKTHSFTVLKYKAGDESKAPLAGATFQLKDALGTVIKLVKVSDTEYRIADDAEVAAAAETLVDSFTTVAAGAIKITGADTDTYKLEETAAPAGFNKLAGDTEVTVLADNSTQAQIANNSGIQLPITGGMGTTVLYAAGALLLIGASIALVVRRRANSAE